MSRAIEYLWSFVASHTCTVKFLFNILYLVKDAKEQWIFLFNIKFP